MKLDNIYIKPYDEVIGNYDKDTLMKNMVFEKSYELIVDNLIATDRRLYYANELLDILKKRMSKAIEYIEQVNKDKEQVPYLTEGETLKLLDILRGKDNE